MATEIYLGDCLEVSKNLQGGIIDLVYLDPPFFTQKVQKLSPRDRKREFTFTDIWKSMDDYSRFLFERLKELHRLLKPTGSIFFHCDHNASHIVRLILDEVFGQKMFRSEIIWHYRRWSNSQRSLLPAHQTIYFYSKSDDYKFNESYQDYSPSTNVDQILQKRARDESGKSTYARDESGFPISNGSKRGVPLSDVWDIPFLNPKARERTGYPTQKPLLLLERIIELSTVEGDQVLDPFCGSGTTLVASQLLNRNSTGINVSEDALEITRKRLKNPEKTQSHLLKVGRDSYQQADQNALAFLRGLDITPVQRNSGIDALLKAEFNGGPVPVRIQRPGESLLDAAYSLHSAAKTKQASIMIVVATETGLGVDLTASLPPEVFVVDSTSISINKLLKILAEKKNLKTEFALD